MFLSYDVRAAYVTKLYDSSMPSTVESLEEAYIRACKKNAEHMSPRPPPPRKRTDGPKSRLHARMPPPKLVRPGSPRTERLYSDGARVAEKWHKNHFNPPVSITFREMRSQVSNEAKKNQRLKRQKKPKEHIPRQPTATDFAYDYVNSPQKKQFKAKQLRQKKQERTQTKKNRKRCQVQKRRQQREYSPKVVRTPPLQKRVEYEDLYDIRAEEQVRGSLSAEFEAETLKLQHHLLEVQEAEKDLRTAQAEKAKLANLSDSMPLDESIELEQQSLKIIKKNTAVVKAELRHNSPPRKTMAVMEEQGSLGRLQDLVDDGKVMGSSRQEHEGAHAMPVLRQHLMERQNSAALLYAAQRKAKLVENYNDSTDLEASIEMEYARKGSMLGHVQDIKDHMHPLTKVPLKTMVAVEGVELGRLQDLVDHGKEIDEKWKVRQHDPKIHVSHAQVMKQVEDEVMGRVEANKAKPAVKANHAVFSSRQFHYEANSIAQKQLEDKKKADQKDRRLTHQKSKRVMQEKKVDAQEEYNPDKERIVPEHAKEDLKDVFTQRQMDMYRRMSQQELSNMAQYQQTLLQQELHVQQKVVQQMRMHKRAKDKTRYYEDKTAFLSAKKGQKATKNASKVQGKKIFNTSDPVWSTDKNTIKVAIAFAGDDTKKVDALVAEGKRKFDMWQARMFDPPVEVEMKEMLGQVEKEQANKLKKAMEPKLQEHHAVFSSRQFHYESNVVAQKQLEDKKKATQKERERTQAQSQKRMADQKKDAQEEYNPDKERLVPENAKEVIADVATKKKLDQYRRMSQQEMSMKIQEERKALQHDLLDKQVVYEHISMREAADKVKNAQKKLKVLKAFGANFKF